MMSFLIKDNVNEVDDSQQLPSQYSKNLLLVELVTFFHNS